MAIWSEVKLSDLYGESRLDAECYRPNVLRDQHALARLQTVKLRQIALVTDGQHGYHKVDPESEIRHITARCVKSGIVTDTDADRLDRATHEANPRSQLEPNDILLSTAGTIGEAGIVTSDILPANIDQDVARITIMKGAPIDPWFLVAFLRSEFGRFQSERSTTGQIQGHISLATLKTFNIPLLPKQNQAADLMKQAVAGFQKAATKYAEAEALLLSSLGLNKLDLSTSLFYVRRYSDTTTAGRVDAEYFSPRYQRVLNHLRQGGQTIGDVAPLAERKFQPQPGATFSYIEIGNLTGDGEVGAEVIDGGDAPSRAQWIVQPGDVISSTVRPIRRLSALISKEQAGHVCSSGFAVLHPTGIEPEVLLVYLRLPIVCEILDLHTTTSMYPAIPVEQLLSIPIALPATSVRDRIVDKVQAAFAARREAARLLDEAKSTVERLILES